MEYRQRNPYSFWACDIILRDKIVYRKYNAQCSTCSYNLKYSYIISTKEQKLTE